jgi:hypothetical protein
LATSKPSPFDSSATDLIKASVTGQPSLKLLDREALEAFVKNVDPNEVLEDEVGFSCKLIAKIKCKFALSLDRNKHMKMK